MNKHWLIPLIILILVIALIIAIIMIIYPQPTEEVGCPTDVVICPDGTEVSRYPPTCEFEDCPKEPVKNDAIIACPADVKLCPGGAVVGRIPPSCEFEECPIIAPVNTTTNNLTKNTTQQPTDPCDQWISWEKKSECYNLEAQKNKDAQVCNKIEPVNFRSDCFRAYAIVNRDPSACIYVTDETECFESTIKRVYDYKKCEKIPTDTIERKSIRQDCAMNAIKRIPEFSACDLTYSNAKKQDCYWTVAKSLNTVEACETMQNTGLWSASTENSANTPVRCFVGVVDETRDISACSKLRYKTDIWHCVKLSVEHNMLSGNRCTGLEIDDEYLCRAIAEDDKELCDQIRNESAWEWCVLLWVSNDCLDTDDGYTYYTKGSAWDDFARYEDFCKDSTTLIEYYCDENELYGGELIQKIVASEEFDCSFRCNDGACIDPPI